MRRLLTALITTVALCGVVAVPAVAHLGDYDSQYLKTKNDAWAACRSASASCWGLRFLGSGAYGEHSRKFVWERQYSDYFNRYAYSCLYENRIDHNNYIFTRVYGGCW